MIQSHIVKIVLGLIKKSFILEGEICWPDFVTLPQGDFKPKQVTPQDKSRYVTTGRIFDRSKIPTVRCSFHTEPR